VIEYSNFAEPAVEGEALTVVAYRIRNRFMHNGDSAAPPLAQEVRDSLRQLLHRILFVVDWKPLPRDAPRRRPPDSVTL
jgi:hypothetical protein